MSSKINRREMIGGSLKAVAGMYIAPALGFVIHQVMNLH